VINILLLDALPMGKVFNRNSTLADVTSKHPNLAQ